jgi:hypothetical protein
VLGGFAVTLVAAEGCTVVVAGAAVAVVAAAAGALAVVVGGTVVAADAGPLVAGEGTGPVLEPLELLVPGLLGFGLERGYEYGPGLSRLGGSGEEGREMVRGREMWKKRKNASDVRVEGEKWETEMTHGDDCQSLTRKLEIPVSLPDLVPFLVLVALGLGLVLTRSVLAFALTPVLTLVLAHVLVLVHVLVLGHDNPGFVYVLRTRT